MRLERASSIADGLLPLQPGDLTFAHAQALVDDLVTVDDDAIAGAVGWLFREARIVAEPSGAASVAAVLQAGASIAPGTVAVISGGKYRLRTIRATLRSVRLQPDRDINGCA